MLSLKGRPWGVSKHLFPKTRKKFQVKLNEVVKQMAS